jgi:membrane-associated phospholipid phosphatase
VQADPGADTASPLSRSRPWVRAGTPSLWVALGAVVVLCLVVVDVLHSGLLSDVDHDISRQIVRWDLRHGAAKPFIYAFTLFGQRGTVLGVSAPIAALLCWRDRSLRVAGLYIAALALIFVVVYGLKDATERTAPPLDRIHVAAGASFPSGHLVNATVLWWLLAVCALRIDVDERIRRTLLGVAWVGPLAVTASMTLLDYHWLSDFLGALCVGLVLRYLLGLSVDRMFRHRLGVRA